MAQNDEAPIEQGGEDVTAMMEEILDKLKILNYEREFLGQQGGNKPLNRAYFAVQINPNEQFNYFQSLVQWLFQLNEVQSGDYTQYDDPVTVATNIQTEAKQLGIECDFPPLQLKTGWGENVVKLLLDLVNRALKTKQFAFQKPKLEAPASTNQQDVGGQEGDGNPDMEENMSVASEEDPEDMLGNEFNYANKEVDQEKQIIESQINSQEWILECERVGPKLQLSQKTDGKEWRVHIEQTKTYSESITKILPEARNKLEKVSDNISKILEKISKREKSINVNLNDLGGEYQAQAEQVKLITNRYQTLSDAVKQQLDTFKQLNEKCEQTEQLLNEHGNSVTDSSPVVKIKSSIQQIKTDIKSMDVRIGVLNHTILQHKLRATRDKGHENDEQINMKHIDELHDM